jgi:cobalt-zinc-cadmium efflux system protein
MAINFVFLIVEVAGGIISGSLALLADAGHMLTDVLALGIALTAIYLADRPPTPKRTFGLVRAEVIGAFINGASLVVIVVLIIIESWKRMSAPVEIDGPLMLAVAVAGLLANMFSTMILFKGRREDLNMGGAFLHMLGDTLGSVAAIVAAVVIWTTGWVYIDIIASIILSVIILWGSLGLLKKTINIILNATPEHIDYQQVRSALCGMRHFSGVHDLHIWTLTSGYTVLSAHVCLEKDCAGSGCWHQCLLEARNMLSDRFGIEHTTIQLEPPEFNERENALHR